MGILKWGETLRMIEYIERIVYYLLQYRQIDDTSSFSKLMHNNELCPSVQQKLDFVLSSFHKYRSITYDIQGFKDEGTDVVLRLSYDDGTKYLCFQIKSNDDLKDKDYLMKLKAQAHDTKMKYGCSLCDYYILVCADLTSKETKFSNKNKLRQIEAAFSSSNEIHVIEPSYVLGFIKLSLLQIDAILKNKLDEQDIVLNEAINIVIDLTPTERALLYYLVHCYIFDGTDTIDLLSIINSGFIIDTFQKVEDYERDWYFSEDVCDENGDFNYASLSLKFNKLDRVIQDRITNDLEYLSHQFIDYLENDNIKLSTIAVLPIVELMIDGFIRYGYKDFELLKYILILLSSGSLKGYEF